MKDLHARLGALADHLAGDIDLRTQADGARARHRRMRRTRLGVAGAAMAVTLVAVGVPLGIGALSATPDDEVTSPGPSPEPPLSAGEAPLTDQAERFRAATGDHAALSAPELSDAAAAAVSTQPCPDVAGLLSDRTGVELSFRRATDPPATTLGGECSWSSDLGSGSAPTRRLDLSLSRPGPAVEIALASARDSAPGCHATTLPEDAFPTEPADPRTHSVTFLWVCAPATGDGVVGSPGQMTWFAFVPDGTREWWGLQVAVGEELPASAGIEGMLALREVAQAVLDAAGAPGDIGDIGDIGDGTALGRRVAEMAARLGALFPNMSVQWWPADPFCPGSSAELRALGFDAQPTGSLDANDGCRWAGAGSTPDQPNPLNGHLSFHPDGPVMTAIGCPSVPVPGWGPDSLLRGCPDGEFTAWTLVVPTDDEYAVWMVGTSGGVVDTVDSSGDGPTSEDLLVALVGLL